MILRATSMGCRSKSGVRARRGKSDAGKDGVSWDREGGKYKIQDDVQPHLKQEKRAEHGIKEASSSDKPPHGRVGADKERVAHVLGAKD